MTYINISRATAIGVLTAGLFLQGCSSTPVAGGVVDGHLDGCPAKDNCISTFSTRNDQKIEPLHFNGPLSAAKTRLKTVLAQRGDNRIVEEGDTYLHVEFTTPLMHFVDDGEFLFGPGTIAIRSASRIGYSDFGKNRSRMAEIKAAFEPCCN